MRTNGDNSILPRHSYIYIVKTKITSTLLEEISCDCWLEFILISILIMLSFSDSFGDELTLNLRWFPYLCVVLQFHCLWLNGNHICDGTFYHVVTIFSLLVSPIKGNGIFGLAMTFHFGIPLILQKKNKSGYSKLYPLDHSM